MLYVVLVTLIPIAVLVPAGLWVASNRGTAWLLSRRLDRELRKLTRPTKKVQ